MMRAVINGEHILVEISSCLFLCSIPCPLTLWFLLVRTHFYNPTKYKGSIPTIVGWVGGQVAIDIEDQTDEEILGDAMRNLKAMFPSIGQPDRVIITRWGQEPNIHGTYTFKIVGRDFADDRRHLRKPVGRVWFAGEATSSWYATTIGAWRTGEEAANEMLEAIRGDMNPLLVK